MPMAPAQGAAAAAIEGEAHAADATDPLGPGRQPVGHRPQIRHDHKLLVVFLPGREAGQGSLAATYRFQHSHRIAAALQVLQRLPLGNPELAERQQPCLWCTERMVSPSRWYPTTRRISMPFFCSTQARSLLW